MPCHPADQTQSPVPGERPDQTGRDSTTRTWQRPERGSRERESTRGHRHGQLVESECTPPPGQRVGERREYGRRCHYYIFQLPSVSRHIEGGNVAHPRSTGKGTNRAPGSRVVVPRPLDSEAFVFMPRPVGKPARSASTVPFTMPPVRAEADMVEAGTSAETAMAPAAMAEVRAAEGETANGVAAVLAGGGCALVEFVGRFACCLGDASKLGSGGICS
mmetsp:Transcript_26800/g.78655  ORF Transcript_26800/g.78655 Transcript_26800/m.78655 type:complete len:218 (+) Transcript_26800:134-787(+)